MKVSYSKLSTFKQCPFKHKRLYMDRLWQFCETCDPYIFALMLGGGFYAKIQENLIFSVRVDRVDKLPNEGCELIDYKTGKNTDIEKEDEHLQLCIYYLALQHRYRIRPTRFTCYFLEDNKKVTTSRSEGQIQQRLIGIKELAEEIKTTEEFLPTPNPFCSFCDFAEVCRAGREREVWLR